MTKKIRINKFVLSIALLIILIVITGTIIFLGIKTTKEIEKDNKKQTSQIETLEQKVSDVETILLAMQEENTTLAEALKEAKEKTNYLENQFDDIDDTVGDLERLNNTDPELLKKYSKVFFLNENYAPTDLREIPSKYVYDKEKTYEIHGEVWPHLEDLLQEVEDNNIDISIISAFRSFGEQTTLKGTYTVVYGAGSANQFSADQGYSEHQLGTTVDFTNSEIGATYSGFSKTETYEWLKKNAYKYGFIMSYPENNQYYEFEPWHWRFVGVKLAKELSRKNANFYDWSQRDIDEYLIYLFD
jgi:LAS superfamily LD-carboxypeptidase LdcB